MRQNCHILRERKIKQNKKADFLNMVSKGAVILQVRYFLKEK